MTKTLVSIDSEALTAVTGGLDWLVKTRTGLMPEGPVEIWKPLPKPYRIIMKHR